MTEPALRKATHQPLHSPLLLLGFIFLLLVSFASGVTASSSSLNNGPSKRMNRIRVRPRVRGDTRKLPLQEPLPLATVEGDRQLKDAKSGSTTKGGYADSGDIDTDEDGDSSMNIFDEESSVEDDFWTVHESSIDTDDAESSPSSSPGGALTDYTSAMDTSLFVDDESPTDAPAVMETETPTDTPTSAPTSNIAKEPAPKNSPSTPTGRPSMAPIAISRNSDSSDVGNKQTSANSYAKKKHSYKSKEAYKISNSKSSNSESNDGANKASTKSSSTDYVKLKRSKKKKHSKKSAIREANKLRKETSSTDSFDEEFVSFDEELGSQDELFDGLAGLEDSDSQDNNNIPEMPAMRPTTAPVTSTDTPTQAPTNKETNGSTDSPNAASSEPPTTTTESPTSTAEDPQTPMPTDQPTRMLTQEPSTAASSPSDPLESPTSSYWTILERPSMMPTTDVASASPTVDTAWVNPYWTIPGMDTASIAAGGKALVPWDCPSNVEQFKSTIQVEFVGSPELLTAEEIYSLEKIVGTLYNAESLAMCDSYVRNLERVELQLGNEGYAFHITASCRDCPLDTTSLLTKMEGNEGDWFAKFFRSSTRASPTSNSNTNSYFNLVSQSGFEQGDGLSSRGLNMPNGRRNLQESSCFCPEDKSPTSPQTVTNECLTETQNVAIQELRTAGIITNIESIAGLAEESK